MVFGKSIGRKAFWILSWKRFWAQSLVYTLSIFFSIINLYIIITFVGLSRVCPAYTAYILVCGTFNEIPQLFVSFGRSQNRKNNIQTITKNGIFRCILFKLLHSHGRCTVYTVYDLFRACTFQTFRKSRFIVYGICKRIDVPPEPTESYIFYVHFSARPFHTQGFLDLCECPGINRWCQTCFYHDRWNNGSRYVQYFVKKKKMYWFIRLNKNQTFYRLFS